MPHTRVVSPGHDRDRSLGWLAVAWMEALLIHGKGDIERTPVRDIPLTDDLAALTVDCYALDEDGRRLYDSVFYSRPKGAAKSEWQAFVAMFEAIGPCRFAGWAKGGEVYEMLDFRYVYEEGEPMGKPVHSPLIRIFATEQGQTGNIYDVVYLNFTEGPLAQLLRHADDAALGRIVTPNGGEIVPATSGAASKDGANPSFAAFDETHLYTTGELKGVYSTERRNLAKRAEAESWSCETSTMYEPGRGSVAEASHDTAWGMVARPGSGLRFFFDHRDAPASADMWNDESCISGLKEAYGDAISYMSVPRLISEMRDPRNDPNDSIRYFFNRAHAGSSMAFDFEAWKRNARQRIVPKGALITIGFDGARTQDSTVLIGTEVETRFQWPVGIWEKPANVKDWRLEDAPVDAAVEDAFTYYNVWRMVADPNGEWSTQVTRWAGKYGQTRVIFPPAGRHSRRLGLTFATYAAAIRGGDVTHDGSPAFAQHIGNAHKYPFGAKGDDGLPLWIIQKDRLMSPHKIDAAWAGAVSYQAALDAVAAGAKAPGGWVVV